MESKTVNSHKRILAFACTAALALGVAACGDDEEAEGGGDTPNGLSGTIQIDGSSTVAPLSEAAAELFQQENPDVRVSVGTSGTGGGFEKFCAGETDISDASRQIDSAEEKLCADSNVEYEEVTVANDALTVVVNPGNPVTCMTVDQLNSIWGPDSTLSSWAEIEDLDADFNEELQLFGPGTDSGTFDYFSEAINGEEGVQRKDYNNVGEDDNATVTGVAGAPGGMGYFGFSFFEENAQQLKALEIDGGDGCVAPSAQSVQDGSYVPLGRELYIYPSAEALEDEAVQEFVRFYIENQAEITEAAGFIPLTEEQADASLQKVEGLAGK